MSVPLTEINNIYKCRRQLEVTYHPAKHEAFQKFCLSLQEFKKKLKEIGQEENLQKFIRAIAAYQFKLCACPLPFNHSSLLTEKNISNYYRQISRYEQVYPDLYPLANHILEQLSYLVHLKENPLLDTCLDIALTVEKENIAILVKQFNLVSLVENCLENENLNYNFTVIVPSDLKSLITYQTIIMMGSPHWFDEYILTAPRTSQLEIVSYHWLKTNWQNKPVFIDSDNFKEVVIHNPHSGSLINNSTENNLIDANDILPPTLNWTNIANEYISKPSCYGKNIIIEAMFFVLTEQRAIFLDVEHKVFTITYNVSLDPQIKKIPVSQIEPEMFILLRSNGDEDYITPFANQILGDKAEQYDNLQKEWKNQLRNRVRCYGIDAISQELALKGLEQAKNPQNIKNWMSEDHIKPRNGFMTILDYLGLGHRSYEFKEAATFIRKAHQQAGFHVSKLLLNHLQNSDFSNLLKLGSMEIELEEIDGVSLMAYRITEVVLEVKQVSASKVGKIIEL